MKFTKYVFIVESGNPKKSCATCENYVEGHTGEDANDEPYDADIHCTRFQYALGGNTSKIKCAHWCKKNKKNSNEKY